MRKFILTSFNTSIIIDTNNLSLFEEIINFDFTYKYIPSVQLKKLSSEHIQDDFFHLKITDTSEENLHFQFEKTCATLVCSLGLNVNLRDIVSVIDYCLDYVRQGAGVYNIHGSSVTKDDKGIIIIGSISGLGKTSLALNLCTQHGFKFVGDEKMLISSDGNIIGGAKMIEFNKPGLFKSVNPDLNNKKIEDLSKLISIEDASCRLSLVIQPLIVTGAKLDVEEWPEIKTEWHLYEEMSRKIRGISRRISNFSYPLDSIDTFEIAQKRINTAKHISKQAKGYCIRGDLKSVMSEIINLLKS